MGLTKTEIFLLNRYEASELAGGLILGKFARKTDDPYLRLKLAWHCSEEFATIIRKHLPNYKPTILK